VTSTRRGTTNRNDRGGSEARRRRKLWLLTEFGDGTKAPCWGCGDKVDYDTITVDRIVPGIDGGTYARENIRPACEDCNILDGNRVRNERRGWTSWRSLGGAQATRSVRRSSSRQRERLDAMETAS
jgi:5-methylcytosine-specific restriction endonuclease McrA